MENAIHINSAAQASAADRADFIRRTYTHLAMSVLAFIVVEAVLLQLPFAESLARTMTDGYAWLVVLGLFMVVSWLAQSWANSETSPQMQYLGLGVYILAEAIIFLPLLFIAANFASPQVIPIAALMTGFLFAGLTAVVFITGKDFSWLGSVLAVGGFVALGFIIASIVFGFSLGIIFCAVMVFYAGGAILYSTSNVLRHYRTDQHVAAALSLFAAVALLFWYILRIVMDFSSDD